MHMIRNLRIPTGNVILESGLAVSSEAEAARHPTWKSTCIFG